MPASLRGWPCISPVGVIGNTAEFESVVLSSSLRLVSGFGIKLSK